MFATNRLFKLTLCCLLITMMSQNVFAMFNQQIKNKYDIATKVSPKTINSKKIFIDHGIQISKTSVSGLETSFNIFTDCRLKDEAKILQEYIITNGVEVNSKTAAISSLLEKQINNFLISKNHDLYVRCLGIIEDSNQVNIYLHFDNYMLQNATKLQLDEQQQTILNTSGATKEATVNFSNICKIIEKGIQNLSQSKNCEYLSTPHGIIKIKSYELKENPSHVSSDSTAASISDTSQTVLQAVKNESDTSFVYYKTDSEISTESGEFKFESSSRTEEKETAVDTKTKKIESLIDKQRPTFQFGQGYIVVKPNTRNKKFEKNLERYFFKQSPDGKIISVDCTNPKNYQEIKTIIDSSSDSDFFYLPEAIKNTQYGLQRSAQIAVTEQEKYIKQLNIEEFLYNYECFSKFKEQSGIIQKINKVIDSQHLPNIAKLVNTISDEHFALSYKKLENNLTSICGKQILEKRLIATYKNNIGWKKLLLSYFGAPRLSDKLLQKIVRYYNQLQLKVIEANRYKKWLSDYKNKKVSHTHEQRDLLLKLRNKLRDNEFRNRINLNASDFQYVGHEAAHILHSRLKANMKVYLETGKTNTDILRVLYKEWSNLDYFMTNHLSSHSDGICNTYELLISEIKRHNIFSKTASHSAFANSVESQITHNIKNLTKEISLIIQRTSVDTISKQDQADLLVAEKLMRNASELRASFSQEEVDSLYSKTQAIITNEIKEAAITIESAKTGNLLNLETQAKIKFLGDQLTYYCQYYPTIESLEEKEIIKQYCSELEDIEQKYDINFCNLHAAEVIINNPAQTIFGFDVLNPETACQITKTDRKFINNLSGISEYYSILNQEQQTIIQSFVHDALRYKHTDQIDHYKSINKCLEPNHIKEFFLGVGYTVAKESGLYLTGRAISKTLGNALQRTLPFLLKTVGTKVANIASKCCWPLQAGMALYNLYHDFAAIKSSFTGLRQAIDTRDFRAIGQHFSQLSSDLTFASLGIRDLFAYHYKKDIKSLEGSEAAAAGQKTFKDPSQTEFAQVVYAVEDGTRIAETIRLNPDNLEQAESLILQKVHDKHKKAAQQIFEKKKARNSLGGGSIQVEKNIVKKAVTTQKFFEEFEFGKFIKQNSKRKDFGDVRFYNGKPIFIIINKRIDHPFLEFGDQFYLDHPHLDHLEVFRKNDKIKCVLNLDGTVNIKKTEIALKQNRTLSRK